MGEKLVKINNEFYSLYDSDGDIVASNNPKTPTTKKLSIANCEAIANGYDLDELAGEYANKELNVELTSKAGNFYGFSSSFKEGFQKALEILGDKKFSEKDMSKAWSEGYHRKVDELNGNGLRYFDKFIQSLQQTEWDVEIVMEKCGYCEGCNKAGMLHCAHADSCGFPIETERPKLDVDGCLILIRC
jgi:hypothetical protein